MAGDEFKKVKPGDPFRFPAAVYNRMLDLTQAGGPEPGGGNAKWTRAADIVKVQNKTGAAVEQFAIVALGAPILTPAAAPDTFRWNLCLTATEAAEWTEGDDDTANFGRWGVLVEPLDVDKIGRAVASGITLCKITVSAGAATDYNTHKRVDVSEATLVPHPRGAGVVLWDDGETGERWALVKIGNPTAADICGELESLEGYDDTKTQFLQHVGAACPTWVDVSDEECI